MSPAAADSRTVAPATEGLLMRSVTYSMNVSLDGYIVGPTAPSTGLRPTTTSSASGSTRSDTSTST
jgi:hypothetical protein